MEGGGLQRRLRARCLAPERPDCSIFPTFVSREWPQRKLLICLGDELSLSLQVHCTETVTCSVTLHIWSHSGPAYWKAFISSDSGRTDMSHVWDVQDEKPLLPRLCSMLTAWTGSRPQDGSENIFLNSFTSKCLTLNRQQKKWTNLRRDDITYSKNDANETAHEIICVSWQFRWVSRRRQTTGNDLSFWWNVKVRKTKKVS